MNDTSEDTCGTAPRLRLTLYSRSTSSTLSLASSFTCVGGKLYAREGGDISFFIFTYRILYNTFIKKQKRDVPLALLPRGLVCGKHTEEN